MTCFLNWAEVVESARFVTWCKRNGVEPVEPFTRTHCVDVLRLE